MDVGKLLLEYFLTRSYFRSDNHLLSIMYRFGTCSRVLKGV